MCKKGVESVEVKANAYKMNGNEFAIEGFAYGIIDPMILKKLTLCLWDE